MEAPPSAPIQTAASPVTGMARSMYNAFGDTGKYMSNKKLSVVHFFTAERQSPFASRPISCCSFQIDRLCIGILSFVAVVSN